MLIFVLIILVYNIIHGYWKGFLRIVYSMVAWIVVLVFVIWSKPYINSFLMENTVLYEKVVEHCEEKIREAAEEKTADEINDQSSGLAELGINLPDSLRDSLMEKTTGAAGEFLENSGMYTQMAKAMANLVMEGISFLIALLAAGIVVHMISQILGIVSKIPILKGVNRFLGIFAGGIYGLMLVWTVFYIIALGSTSEFGSAMISYIYESEFLKFLYENNLVLTLLLHYL